MKIKYRGLSLAALLLSASNLTFADQGLPTHVGDEFGLSEEAYFAKDSTFAPAPSHLSSQHVGDMGAAPASQFVGSDEMEALVTSPEFVPIDMTQLRQVGHRKLGSRLGTVACDGCGSSDCDSGCDAACGKKARDLCTVFDRVDPCTWASVEFLTWFTQDRDMPPLIATSNAGTLPVLPDAGAANPNNVQVVFGDDINGEVSGGYRSDFGRWMTDSFGVGTRFWILAENNDSYFGSGDGTGGSIGRPFFNINRTSPPGPPPYGEDALLVAATVGAGFTGSIAAESSLDMLGGEAYTRLRVGNCKDHSVDFISGFSHFEIDDKLWIQSRTLSGGNVTTIMDLFRSDNEFNGGQLGFDVAVKRGNWMLRSLTKVHLGNMNQKVRIQGARSTTVPVATGTRGLFAFDNAGTYERDVFAFVPEANFKLGYKICRNAFVSVGYSFLYFDNVTLNGDVVDRLVDGQAFANNTAATRPQFDFDDSSLWVQGLDLGVLINF